jgi:DNA-binding transcriptional ArsR family regulator
MFKAIGHPARVAILDYLLKVNACITGDIVNELPWHNLRFLSI